MPYKKLIKSVLLVSALLTMIFGPMLATKPGEILNPNGFPSGKHYNLNIIGKKSNFVCPEQEYDEFGNPIYGNVIFVPENGQGIQILMQSGKKGKKVKGIPTLQVIDPCTALFDSDEAIVQLPKNEFGYDVYARALATPTDNPWMTVEPSLFAVEDENGNSLIWLGIVTPTGFVSSWAEFTRMKGKPTAIEITDLFMWTGKVCYLIDDPAYCDPCTLEEVCAIDEDGDGYYDRYEPLNEFGECDLGTKINVWCKTYDQPTWVFNVADFVTYLWDVNNNGLKLLQIRFYPRSN